MNEDDNEFFILVLGVLAAIILVVSWWYWSGGNAVPAQQVSAVETAAEAEPTAAPDPTAAPEPTAVPDPTAPPEPTAEPDPTAAPEPTAEPAPVAPGLPSTVVDVMSVDAGLGVVTDLLGSQGLDEVLTSTGPFTVLAPTDDAINEAAESDTTVVVLETALESVLTYHVLPGTLTLDELRDIAGSTPPQQLITAQGEPLSLSLDGDNIVINGNTVITGDGQQADNGVVYTLDNVLIPPVAALNSLVAIEPILFASGSATIDDRSTATLDRFIEVLDASSVGVEIGGHTDSSGDAILNQNLSQNRAQAVLNYLVANGIAESRLSADGFGSSKPVADNDSEEGRALNRRIEFTLAGQ